MSLALCVVLCLKGIQLFLATLEIRSFLPSLNHVRAAKCNFIKNVNFPSIQQMFINGPDTVVHTKNAAVKKMEIIFVLIEVMIYFGNRY